MSDEDSGKTCALDICCMCKEHCCFDARPPLSVERRKAIEAYFSEKKIKIQYPFTFRSYHFATADDTGLCVFYDKQTKQCVVHPVKPETCRAGPVTFDINCSTRKIEWHLKMTSVCAFARRLVENPERFQEHLKIAKRELMRLVCQLEPEDLQAILKIPEPLTFKVGEDDLPQSVAEKVGLE